MPPRSEPRLECGPFPFRYRNGGSIIEFTHRRRWRLCRDSRAKRNGISRYSKVQVKALSAYFHSIVKDHLWFAPVCSIYSQSQKTAVNPWGSNLGHGFSGHPGRSLGSRRVTENRNQKQRHSTYCKVGKADLEGALRVFEFFAQARYSL